MLFSILIAYFRVLQWTFTLHNKMMFFRRIRSWRDTTTLCVCNGLIPCSNFALLKEHLNYLHSRHITTNKDGTDRYLNEWEPVSV